MSLKGTPLTFKRKTNIKKQRQQELEGEVDEIIASNEPLYFIKPKKHKKKNIKDDDLENRSNNTSSALSRNAPIGASSYQTSQGDDDDDDDNGKGFTPVSFKSAKTNKFDFDSFRKDYVLKNLGLSDADLGARKSNKQRKRNVNLGYLLDSGSDTEGVERSALERKESGGLETTRTNETIETSTGGDGHAIRSFGKLRQKRKQTTQFLVSRQPERRKKGVAGRLSDIPSDRALSFQEAKEALACTGLPFGNDATGKQERYRQYLCQIVAAASGDAGAGALAGGLVSEEEAKEFNQMSRVYRSVNDLVQNKFVSQAPSADSSEARERPISRAKAGTHYEATRIVRDIAVAPVVLRRLGLDTA